MKELVNRAFMVSSAVVFIALCVSLLTWRFTNIDMTETRLLITYWKQLSILVGLLVVFSVGHEVTK